MSTQGTWFFGSRLSPNITETPEGFLVCRNVPIARTGTQRYAGQELKIEGMYGKPITCYRLAEDVFKPECLASFEGKPVTDDHPKGDDFVFPENYGLHVKGHLQNVRRDGQYIVADLMINDAVLIEKIKSGKKRQVSAGYLFKYERYKDGFRATDIRANHVAVVSRGRAGAEVAIKDSQPSISFMNKRSVRHMTLSEKKSALLLAWAKDTDPTPEEFNQMLKVLDDDGDDKKDEDKTEKKEAKDSKKAWDAIIPFLKGKDKKAKDEDGGDDKKKEDDKEEKKAEDALQARFSRIEDALSVLLESKAKDEGGEEPEKKEEDKEDKKAEDADATAKDAAFVQIPKAVLAKIPDKYQQMLKDSARPEKSASSAYAGIRAIAKDKRNVTHAAKGLDAVQEDPKGLGDAIMATKNPHYMNQEKAPESKFWG